MIPVWNHLWQSTLFAAAVFALTLLLRKNRAQARYWLWLAASMKFLIPFSLLVSAGRQVEWRNAPPIAPAVKVVASQITEPFTPIAMPLARQPRPSLPYLPVLWTCGSIAVLAMWLRQARRLSAIVRAGSPCPGVAAPIPVLSAPTLLEPGVIGAFRPVLLLPAGLHENLTVQQMDAIVAHEMCHVRRRDNFAAMFHMAVETLFWFHPLVWWIGSRLIEERERACDEEVLQLGNAPQVYAEGILNVCKFYLRSPLPCAAGVTGADLKKRVLWIMTNHVAVKLTFARKLLVAASAVTAIAVPLLLGVFNISAQATGNAKYDVASVRINNSAETGSRLGPGPNGGIQATNATAMKLITFAYDLREFQVEGGPNWLKTARFDVIAKEDDANGMHPRDMNSVQRLRFMNRHRECMRNLLAERFQLAVKRDSKERPGYVLTVGASGHKLQPSTVPEQKQSMSTSMGTGRGQLKGQGPTIDMIANALSDVLGRKVVDQTGIKGVYDFSLEWTPEGAAASELANTGSIFTSVQEQLGLKLESKKVPVEIIVVDRLEKPTEN